MCSGKDETETRQACARLRSAKTRAELAEALYQEVSGYSLLDLQALRGRVERDLRSVPNGYRQRLYPRVMEQLFGTHHTLISTARRGDLDLLDEPLAGDFQEFCEMVENTCISRESNQRLGLLYYLLAAFNLFVLERPAHPVGTPFPGGFEVEVRDGEYLCPVREKADDVENALCPYCPAKQSDT
ncbi:MAG TPA: DUF2115 domain-containing protein [Candidatus Methanoculleus thermohydrogenotrophicum]|jgi:uncharacterized protein (UPF0305 family)|nr:DUF2115 domain-containing protein [Candidatus Methanoculleus thermohydrogenotrophicum]HQE09628.1 DUF2115 domain-containing protein [Bacillota bacterium]NLM82159.1 DUF2115 domain-containing protein [Candidatus Methanoculleus thermohydrogenotrophicum]HOB17499.1 DUF2115 domain-containing protein [Candidatus Methanoculleus thermohydrogenotrophicum]HPZ37654.1 DUF2115 domain-containing protein [Candidatus Methanoculleus thermohydrogenotrophicum]